MKILKKHSKKLLGLFTLVLVVIASLVTINVFADTMPTLKITKIEKTENKQRGDTVSVNVELDNSMNKDYAIVAFVIKYDPEALTFSRWRSKDANDIFESVTKDVDQNKGEIILAYASTVGEKNYSGDLMGIDFTLTNKASGEESISVEQLEMRREPADGQAEGDLVETKSENGFIYVNVPVDQDSIRLTQSDINLSLADEDAKKAKLEVEYTEGTTDEANLSFTSNDTGVVTVDNNGNITAVGNGTTTITVNAFGKTLTANVKVETPITGIDFDKKNISLVMGSKETETITATVKPTNTSMSKDLIWTSSNEAVATVVNGVVTAKGNGTAVITAKAKDNESIVQTANVEVYVPITGATVTPNNVTLNKSATEQLTLNITPNGATHENEILWSSEDESVATVDNSGLVTAIGGGTTNIKVEIAKGKDDERTLTIPITVNVPLTGISVDETALDLLPNQKHQIIVTPNEADYTGSKTINYSSDAEGVAKVNASGEITAVAAGDANITVSLQGKSATIRVHVIKAINDVVISEPTVQINKNEEKELSAVLDPIDPEQKYTINWKSSKEDVVKIIKTEGNKVIVKGLKGGKSTITGTVKYGEVTKTITSEVTVYVPVTNFTAESSSLEIVKNKTATIKTTITPSDATYPEISWSSDDETIATVADGVVTAHKVGNTTITGEVHDGQRVVVAIEVVQPITSVTLDKTTNFTMNKGETTKITATVGPNDATEDKTVTYKSSNENVATIDADGNVIAKANGKTTITAKAGNVTSKGVEITVVVPVDSITMDATATVVKNKTIKLVPTINPTDATDKSVTWESKNPTIATVDANGVVKGLAQGDATIVAKSSNGKIAECVVTVTIIPVDSISFAQDEITINKNQTRLLGIVVNPTDATELEEFSWVSDDEDVLTVDENGKIKGIKEGTANVTVTMGTFTATIKVNVKEIPLESISINKDNLNNLNVGDMIDIEIIKNPIDATDDVDFTYTSSDENIIKIDANGRITAVAKGKATITVKASNGMETSIDVEVKAEESPNTGVESIAKYGILSVISLGGICISLKKVRA